MLETSADSPVPVRVVSEAIGDYLSRLGAVWIEGELSEVTVRPGAQMVFMRLKDTSADMSISIMCHKSVLESVQPLPQNARVVMNSKVSWYAKNGSLSFSVKEIRQIGIGELIARLEALKELLYEEGLFETDRKKELPFLPKAVGLICGRNSDAEKDVVENAKRRWPSVRFEIREVAVQGAAAVVEVSAALKELDEHPDVDVIIITRGGGSFEDLLAFSDESLVRLAANCQTPIVSAIGHEKDAPLLDLVADWRASTPTDAGKKVVPDMDEELTKIANLRERAKRYVQGRIDFEISKIQGFMDRPSMKEPLTMISSRLEIITNLRARSFRSTNSRLWLATEEIASFTSQVRTLSPQATLERGYSVVQKADGRVVRNASELTKGDRLRIRLAKGEGTATSD
ncbi:MAG: exodeoxyribonuclease VII large subunit [Actinobacteria bacterium]|nr:exodeoxyribonuclease VII large subunit [Actinomycetota bacterium]